MKVQLFYHVALMGPWRKVVREQMNLFAQAGLRPIVGVVGPWNNHIRRLVRGRGRIALHLPELHQFETPTLQELWEWCRSLDDPGDTAVIYAHTKGVSKPGPMRHAWRKLMEHWVVSRWRENIGLLNDHDATGVNLRTTCQYCSIPHFAGTFWMARADWITRLPSPREYRAAGHQSPRAHTPDKRGRRQKAKWGRMHAEMWIGSVAGGRLKGLACTDEGKPCVEMFARLLRECGHEEYV